MKSMLLFLMTFCFSTIYSQINLEINGGLGRYLIHSENSQNIMGNKEFDNNIFYGFSIQKENLLGINLKFEYTFHKMIEENVISFYRYSHGDYSWIGDISYLNHNFDFNYIGNINSYLFYGIGPSFVITNRIFEVKQELPISQNKVVYDKLASSGIGLNSCIEFIYPSTKLKNSFFIISKLKLRYTHSLWFDKGIRKLDDYYQEFFTINLSLGIGYLF